MEKANTNMKRRRFTEKDYEEISMAPNSKPLDILAVASIQFMKILQKDVTTPPYLVQKFEEILAENKYASYVFDEIPRREKEEFASKERKRKPPKTELSWEEEIKCKEKKKKRKTCVTERPKPLPLQLTLPQVVENRIRQMNGYDVKLLIQKWIFAADIEPGQNRLSIPRKQIRDEAKDFLTEDEEATLSQRFEDNHVVYLEVPLLEPNLECTTIKFRKWNMAKSCSYVLTGTWALIQERNKLRVGMTMQVWSFRVDTKLHFALVNLTPEITQEELYHQSELANF